MTTVIVAEQKHEKVNTFSCGDCGLAPSGCADNGCLPSSVLVRNTPERWLEAWDSVKGMKKTFNVYSHPIQGFKAVKVGFSWPAFFFGNLWMLVKQLWGLAATGFARM